MPNEPTKSVLLLPGMDGTGVLFSGLIAELPRDWQVTVARYATDEFLIYEQLVAQLQTILPQGRFLLVAESFSTPLAVRMAASLPERVTGLVLVAGFVANPMGRRSAIAKILARPAAFRTRPPLWLLRKFLLGDGATGELAERLRAVIRSVSPDVLAQRARAVLSCDERATLARTQMPLPYLRGKYDRVVGAECFEGIRKIRPDAQLEVVDSAHLLLQCQPRLTARHIVQFADETATNSQREQ